MRIDKFLSQMGFGTRSEVKVLIKKGVVTCNQDRIKSPKFQIDADTDLIEVNGEKVQYEPFQYLMMNKPKGVISATEDPVHETVIDLVKDNSHLDLFPVGRLDKDTEGLLFITNDGKFNHELMSPNKHVAKTYWVEAKNQLEMSNITAFEKGITLKEGLLKPAQLEILEPQNTALVTIQEGKYHQVKRMFHAIDNEVLALKRIAIGDVQLDETLKPGECRALTAEELTALYPTLNSKN
ncbi:MULTISPECIES: pseudouridine synthase [Staphylococcus]|uniref:Pseudouridine synthase n=1 Tax=Staphylococcus coagulans TaxID=74706 RepID=A0A9X0PE32_9STAP|nr:MULTISPECIES: pseudouridine synthase [Staphylococcus]NHA35837.1 16S rRNA pseudouridine(516) synthase [Staphylococcus schleiferi]MBA8771528.1 rRNA pseudouridine synthase [Staphylococcus coagulans]MBA8775483.1 rRNA pseudouridine synthase [Staphylococcus coagulans]NHB71543.1 16S rRNA pseudouridine(516) synthase [Staphylococcus sp. 191]UNB49516.1 rRNA pseudouridine synthase [Staphylococcus coagulans]